MNVVKGRHSAGRREGKGVTKASIDSLLADARRRLARLTPVEADAAMQRGALLIDTRPIEQRERDGEIFGSIVIDRSVLEWRLDPTSADRIPELSKREGDRPLIIMCNEGYSSSLAAATLQGLGLRNVTDVIGGFQSWVASGLPVRHITTGAEEICNEYRG
jgi:rhodanese-related sulfurtransferase